MGGFKHGPYDIFPAGQRLRNEGDSPAKWMPLASIIRWHGDEVLALPVSWYRPALDTEQMPLHSRQALP
jgi:hypothetical protein